MWRRTGLLALANLTSASLFLSVVVVSAANGRIDGVVRDKATGAPIPGVTIRVQVIRSIYEGGGDYVFGLRTGSAGTFVFEAADLLKTHLFYILACKEGYVEYPPGRGLRETCQNCPRPDTGRYSALCGWTCVS